MYVLVLSICESKMNSNKSRIEERSFIMECIRVYRSLPCLWKVKSEEYTDRIMKKKAYDILVQKYQERYLEADRDFVKKKINSLRTNFRKELRKISDSKKLGDEKGYESTLWYFNEMLFLQDQENEPESGSIKLVLENSSPLLYISGEEDNREENSMITHQISQTRKKSKIRKSNIQVKYKDPEMINHSKRYIQDENEYVNIAMAWATELQNMDIKQQIFAKRAINEVLYEGQLGTLHRHSVKINATSNDPSTL